jgi:hypothetical protein
LKKYIVKEAQKTAFAKDIVKLFNLPGPSEEGVLKIKVFTAWQDLIQFPLDIVRVPVKVLYLNAAKIFHVTPSPI